MEYIDNAFDSADTFYCRSTNSYSKPIDISIEISGKSYKDTIVKIKDNCTGINDITRIASSIGNSDKADNKFLNGQFAVGAVSFLGVCDNLKIATKVSDSNIDKTIELNSNMFDKSTIEEVAIPMIIERVRQRNDGSSYTTVVLSSFDKDKFTEFSADILKFEIEKHFEILLMRKNITVSLKNENNIIQICKPFDYSAYEGAVFEKTIDSLEYTYSKKYNTTRRIDISEKPIKIFLKITNNKVLGRKPFFVLKNRRITEVSNIRAFNSISKSRIWSHPTATGYVEISDLLEPTISRSEFKNTIQSRALFQTLLKIEPEIKNFVDENVSRLINNRFEKLGKILSNALKTMALKDLIKKQSGLKEGSGNISNHTNTGDDQSKVFEVFNIQPETIENEIVEVEEDAITHHDNKQRNNIFPKIPDDTIELPVKAQEIKSKRNNQNDSSMGLNIKIDFENEPMRDTDNKLVRSIINDDELTIYKKHPEFEKRLDISMHGLPRISASLISYLCCEIMVHYKLIANFETKGEYDNKELLNNFVESVYILEANLKQIENMKISDFV